MITENCYRKKGIEIAARERKTREKGRAYAQERVKGKAEPDQEKESNAKEECDARKEKESCRRNDAEGDCI
ncbi:hypothetical protein DPMN_053228 [Dreissena polymorpha]|uniref:Uncharacterized protein n=1 Tax=Dreissena polymorpha TaxID=45954 RepID=A0A9D4CMX7_DREPO|nr:hypothetical protein DPMN_053228 [Dreissena polymorpha]